MSIERTSVGLGVHARTTVGAAIDEQTGELVQRRMGAGNAKQIVLLGSANAKKKGSDGTSFLAHEVKVMAEFDLPIVVANLDGDRTIDRNFIPDPLLAADYYTLSVSFQPSIIKYALDN
ncbi:MAG: hypothetical protein NT132_12925 [Microbacterium sp.]|uniref:hypothetical protein n=1 Tax=Microbacterium sp. TaxID=51671 RepID=UPI002609B0CF|nr:hypothetical protein [Microbacterium sp.]MCX6503281.1 hypothetical protein [Microbacterium sp.]